MNEELVITPGGLRPNSKVHMIKPGHKLIVKNNHIQELDSSGKFVDELGEVSRRPGDKPLVSEQAADLGSGWITRAYWDNNTGGSFSNYRTNWFVPPPPSTQSGQVIFVFNALLNPSSILQPILQWGSAGGGGGNYWSVASWYVLSSGDAHHSPFARVNPGQNLDGVISLTSQTSLDYNCQFQGIAQTSFNAPALNENFTRATVALEAYGITRPQTIQLLTERR